MSHWGRAVEAATGRALSDRGFASEVHHGACTY
jgi:hypothetical protein